MSQRRFNPSDEIQNLGENIRNTINKAVDSVVGTQFPAVDVYEVGNAIVIKTAPIAGLDTGSIEVSMSGSELTISGHVMTDSHIPEEAIYLHRECFSGDFERTVNISVPVKANEATAKYAAKILTITLPRLLQDDTSVVKIETTS